MRPREGWWWNQGTKSFVDCPATTCATTRAGCGQVLEAVTAFLSLLRLFEEPSIEDGAGRANMPPTICCFLLAPTCT